MAAAATKQCRYCRFRMPADAIYCTKCQNFQNWRRNLSLSSTVLALLVALASVLGTAVPAILTALTPKNSDIRISVQTVSDSEISAFISNAGIRPAMIQPRAYLKIAETNGVERTAMLLGQGPDQEVVPPGTSVLRRYGLTPIAFKTTSQGQSVTDPSDIFIKTGRELHCEVTLFGSDFLGNSEIRESRFDCNKLPTIKIPRAS